MRASIIALGLSFGMPAALPAGAQQACEILKDLDFPDVRITEAKAGPAPAYVMPQGAAPVPACRVVGVIGREIKFSVTMPEAWNGKFAQGGQGGFAGQANVNQAGRLHNALALGYATADTDTGHVSLSPSIQAWALDPFLREERMVNYAHAAVHRVAVTAKAVIRAHYGRDPDKSYFAGCSNGGRQALMSVLRYPEDFDGVVAGAPAYSFATVVAPLTDVVRRTFTNAADPGYRTLDKADRLALGKATLAACDGKDGLEDGVISDPEACRFDPKTVACRGGQTDGCLSPAGLAAVQSFYSGPRENAVSYGQGFPIGHEELDAGGWGFYITGDAFVRPDGAPVDPAYPSLGFALAVGGHRYLAKADPAADYLKPTLASIIEAGRAFAAQFDAGSSDLSAFRKRGGKILLWHGWADAAISARASIDYADRVYATDASARSDVRLFMAPGIAHCAGGPGPQQVDWLTTLDKWATGGPPPDEVTASFAPGAGARKLCAYPRKQAFKGQGDGRSPDQFECR